MRKFQGSSKGNTPAELQQVYVFGEFTLDGEQKVLLRNKAPLPLAPKVFETLLILVENGGRIVEKDALMNRVWPDTFVEEANLTFNIQQLRKALGDNARSPSFIETVARRGYRFIAPVTAIGNGSGFEAEAARHPERPPTARTFRVVIVCAVLAALVLGGVAFYLWRSAKKNQPVARIRFQNAQVTRLSNGKALKAAISPDGKQVAYVLEEKDGQSLWLRRTTVESSVQIVPSHKVNFMGVNFSRDGDLIYYLTSEPQKSEGTLYSVPVLGGPTRKLFDGVTSPIGLSHDGARVAFTVCRPESGGVMRLLVASVDGSNEHQVYEQKEPFGLSAFTPPAWSPDDSRIAILRTDTREALSRFVAINLQDGSATDLTANEWKIVNGLDWKTDGLFVSGQHQTNDIYQIWQIDPTQQTAAKLTNDLNRYDGISLASDRQTLVTIQNLTLMHLWLVGLADPKNSKQITSGLSTYFDVAFTPQGKLLYSSVAQGAGDLWQMDADDRNHIELTNNAGGNYSPVSAPDGRFVFFVSSRGKTYSIYRSLADGSEARKLTDDDEEEAQPDCSRDGKAIVFQNYLQASQPLKKVSADGGKPALLNNKWNASPAISPDGNLVAVWHAEVYADEWKLALIPLQTGGNPTKTFSVSSSSGRIRWTADGRSLLYIVTTDGVSNIWRQPIDGGKPVPVTQFQNELIFSFDISPDGKTLVCERGTTAQDVIVLSD